MPDDPDHSPSEAKLQHLESTEFPKPGAGRAGSQEDNNDWRHHLLPHRFTERLHLPEDVEILDPRFWRYSHNYLMLANCPSHQLKGPKC